jgi:hypothetical protein
MANDTEIDEELLEQVKSTLEQGFTPVSLDDVNSEDLYTVRDVQGILKNKYDFIPLELIDKMLRELDFQSHLLGGTFYWLLRSKSSL